MSLPEHHVVTLVLFMLSFQCNEIWTCQRRESFNGGLFLSGAKVHSWESRSGLKVMKSELWERKSEESTLHPDVAQMSSVGDLKPVFCLTQQSCLFLSGGITIKTKSTRPHKLVSQVLSRIKSANVSFPLLISNQSENKLFDFVLISTLLV